MNSFSDVVCLKLLGSEFRTLGPVYLVDCFPKEMVLNGGNIREWFLLRLYSDSLCEKRADIGRGPSMESFVDLCG